jgi:dTDP-4-amino-4,6-dideoxygalactose transaminase
LRVAFDRVLASGRFVSGHEVAGFEATLAERLGVSQVVGVSSGTSAVSLALRAAGVVPGDEVILPANTFFATAEAVVLAGARPVLVDADPTTASVNPAAVEASVTRRTTAIIAVHLYGTPADMDRLRAIADRHSLLLLEDSAQALGSLWHGRPAGSLGDAAAMSFFPTKNLGALGEAGAVATNDPVLARRVRQLRDHGQPEKNNHVEVGANERLDELQAAFLAVKLAHFSESVASRRRLSRRYRRRLETIAGVSTLAVPLGADPAFHLMVAKVPNRDTVLAALHAEGIGAAVHYPVPIHLQPACRFLGQKEGSFPGCEALSRSVLSLPFFPEMTIAQMDRCLRALARVVVP